MTQTVLINFENQELFIVHLFGNENIVDLIMLIM
jgi:hypothetical protein